MKPRHKKMGCPGWHWHPGFGCGNRVPVIKDSYEGYYGVYKVFGFGVSEVVFYGCHALPIVHCIKRSNFWLARRAATRCDLNSG